MSAAHYDSARFQANFAQALPDFRAIVGDKWVITDAESLFAYRAPDSTVDDDVFLPSAVIAPASVEEVQAIMKAANKHNTPFWPISTGKNYMYGGPAPRVKGTGVLDLRRMNKILEINEHANYALLEPGVSFLDLQAELRRRDTKLWVCPAAPGWGGVVGNALDRGVGWTPYGDNWGSQCGMEVVLPNGELLRTGMGAMPGSETWQAFKYGFGPHVDGIFTQSNFGVVTKMGIWLMQEPPVVKPVMVSVEHEEDLGALVEALRPLRVAGLLPGALLIFDYLSEAAIEFQRSDFEPKQGLLSEASKKAIREKLNCGVWNLYTCFYGTQEIVDASYAIFEATLKKIKGARFFLEGSRDNRVGWKYRTMLMRGQPNMGEFNQLNWIGGGGHVAFSPILPLDGGHSMKIYHLIRDLYNEAGFDPVIDFAIGGREMHCVLMFFFNRTDPAERKRANDVFRRSIFEAAKLGYGEYRTHLNFMDDVASTYSFNNHALLRFHETLKDAIDPNGILAPGKSGIWPRGMRA